MSAPLFRWLSIRRLQPLKSYTASSFTAATAFRQSMADVLILKNPRRGHSTFTSISGATPQLRNIIQIAGKKG